MPEWVHGCRWGGPMNIDTLRIGSHAIRYERWRASGGWPACSRLGGDHSGEDQQFDAGLSQPAGGRAVVVLVLVERGRDRAGVR